MPQPRFQQCMHVIRRAQWILVRSGLTSNRTVESLRNARVCSVLSLSPILAFHGLSLLWGHRPHAGAKTDGRVKHGGPSPRSRRDRGCLSCCWTSAFCFPPRSHSAIQAERKRQRPLPRPRQESKLWKREEKLRIPKLMHFHFAHQIDTRSHSQMLYKYGLRIRRVVAPTFDSAGAELSSSTI